MDFFLCSSAFETVLQFLVISVSGDHCPPSSLFTQLIGHRIKIRTDRGSQEWSYAREKGQFSDASCEGIWHYIHQPNINSNMLRWSHFNLITQNSWETSWQQLFTLNKITEKFIVWKPIPFGTIAKLKLWPKRRINRRINVRNAVYGLFTHQYPAASRASQQAGVCWERSYASPLGTRSSSLRKWG